MQTETCADAWPLAAPNKRAALRLLCDLLPSRPQSAAHAWVERTARTQLPQWAAAGQGALVAPVVLVLLRVVATGASGEEGYPWLPEAVTALLSSLGGLQGQGQRQRQLGLRVCDLLYHCPAWPPELQEAVVGVVHGAGAGEGGLLVDYLVEVRACVDATWVWVVGTASCISNPSTCTTNTPPPTHNTTK